MIILFLIILYQDVPLLCARVLLNLAYAIITYIQKNGPSPELIGEARSSLAAANQLVPGEPRFIRLMASLNELTSAA